MYPNSDASGGAWDSASVERFAWRDLFRSVRLAFGFVKWLTALLPVVVGAVAYKVLVDWLPEQAGLEPGSTSVWLLYVLAAIIGYLAVVFAASGVAYLVRGEILDNMDRTFDDVAAFWKRRFWTLLGAPLMMLILAALMLVFPLFLGIIAWLLDLIPEWGLGTLFWSLTLILSIPLGIVSAVVLAVLALGSFVYPAIVAVKEEEAFDVVHDLFDLVINRGPMLVLAIVLTGLFIAVAAAITWAGTNLALCIGVWWLDESALALPWQDWPSFRSFFDWLTDTGSSVGWAPFAWEKPSELIEAPVAGFFFGLWLFLTSVGFIAYAVSLYSAAGTMSYLIMADPLDIEDVLQRARSAPQPESYAPASSPGLEPAGSPPQAPEPVPATTAPSGAEEPESATPAAPLAPPAGETSSAATARASKKTAAKRSSTPKSKSPAASKKKTIKKSAPKKTAKSGKKKKT